jgi:hypothetical protein
MALIFKWTPDGTTPGTDLGIVIGNVDMHVGQAYRQFLPYGGSSAADWYACQRYFQTSWPMFPIPGYMSGYPGEVMYCPITDGAYSGSKYLPLPAIRYKVGMQANPANPAWDTMPTSGILVYSTATIADGSGHWDQNGVSKANITGVGDQNGFRLFLGVGPLAITAGDVFAGSWSAEAEL